MKSCRRPRQLTRRASKLKSHRYFKVVDIPDYLNSGYANGIGGPKTISYGGEQDGEILKIIGTGALNCRAAVCTRIRRGSNMGRRRNRRAHHRRLHRVV